MSIEASKQVRLRSRATGPALAVLHELANAVRESDVQAGRPWRAWPSQGRVAWNLNVRRRAVSEAIRKLKQAGEIREAGVVGRGAKVWEITLPAVPKEPYDPNADYADDPVDGDEPTSKSTGVTEKDNLRRNRRVPTSKSVVEPTSKSTTEPEVGEPEEEPEEQHTRAAGVSKEQLRTDWRRWLGHFHETTERTHVKGSGPARRSFAARRNEGRTVEELMEATVGCHGDDYLRENGFDSPETILRASKFERYIDLARRASGGPFISPRDESTAERSDLLTRGLETLSGNLSGPFALEVGHASRPRSKPSTRRGRSRSLTW